MHIRNSRTQPHKHISNVQINRNQTMMTMMMAKEFIFSNSI